MHPAISHPAEEVKNYHQERYYSRLYGLFVWGGRQRLGPVHRRIYQVEDVQAACISMLTGLRTSLRWQAYSRSKSKPKFNKHVPSLFLHATVQYQVWAGVYRYLPSQRSAAAGLQLQ